MIHIKNLKDGLPVYDALASDIRIKILELLYKKRNLNLDDIAKELKITNGGLTKHIKKLSESGLIHVDIVSTSRGIEKQCALAEEKIFIDLFPYEIGEKCYDLELDVGQFSSYDIAPTCGMASSEKLLGELDDTKYFSYPERYNANILWFASGYIEYLFPNPTDADEEISEIQISFEIASEAPGAADNYPSDIYFALNGVDLCFYRSPGEFFDRPGRLNPKWYNKNFGQYGRQKIITVNDKGTYLDGLYINELDVGQFRKDVKDFYFRVSVPSWAKHVGGATLFGKNFGDYNQGIKLKIYVK